MFIKEESVINLGRQIIGITFPFYFVYPLLQVFGDSMRGVGRSKVPMIIILINICLARTALLFIIVPYIPNVRGVAAVYPITWTLTAVCMVVYYLRFHKNTEMQNKEEMSFEA